MQTSSLISQLRTRLEACRWQIKCGSDALSESLDIPQRVKRELSAHPWRWVAAGLACGTSLAWLLPAREDPPAAPPPPPPPPVPALFWQQALVGAVLSLGGALLANAILRSAEIHPSVPASTTAEAVAS